ncbi:MAG: glycosyltransferase family 4 protein [Thiobacillaceae bacterium]
MKSILLGPSLTAVSGVSTHLNQLFGSVLGREYELLHFQVGSEGLQESATQKLWRFVASPFAFSRFVHRQGPSIVHLNSSLEPKSYWRDLAYLVVAKLLRRLVVYQVHGGALPQDFFRGNPLLTGFLRWSLRLPDVVVLLAQVELDAYRSFLPGQRLELVANAIEAAELSVRDLAAPRQGSLRLAYLGRLAEDKGIFEAVEATARLRSEGRVLRLDIAGGGPDETRLKQRISALDLHDCVRLHGPLFGEAKSRLWREADVFVFPTYHREGLPYALLEAMAAGAVPVTSRVGAIPDVLADGVHGLFVEARDVAGLAAAIARLDDDRDLLGRLARAGRERVLSQYTVARLAADFARIYRSLEERAA